MVRYHDLIMDMQKMNQMKQEKQTMIKEEPKIVRIFLKDQYRHFMKQSSLHGSCLLSYRWESNAPFSPGRLDRHLAPYYEKDIKEGILDKQQALEIIECLVAEI